MQKLFVVAMMAMFLAACGKSAEDKITAQVTENVHALTADERPLAQTNAKAFFEKEVSAIEQDHLRDATKMVTPNVKVSGPAKAD